MSFATRHDDMIQNLRNNIAIVEAFQKGDVIQYRLFADVSDSWEDIPFGHSFNFNRYDYRVKHRQREVFIVTHPDDKECIEAFLSQKEAEGIAEEMVGEHGDSSGMVRKFIEVLE